LLRQTCHKAHQDHDASADHGLGVPDMLIQRILRHANVSTTATYYIKTAADDVRNAMAKLENSIPSNAAPEWSGESRPQTRVSVN
jgi:integrase